MPRGISSSPSPYSGAKNMALTVQQLSAQPGTIENKHKGRKGYQANIWGDSSNSRSFLFQKPLMAMRWLSRKLEHYVKLCSASCIQCIFFKIISSSSSLQWRECLFHNTQASYIPVSFTVACSSQIWLFHILWYYKALHTRSLPQGTLRLVRSTWPNQCYYKTLGKCYIGVLLIHSIAFALHDCMWKIWWLASLLTYGESSQFYERYTTTELPDPGWFLEVPLAPDLIYFQGHQTSICYQISITLLEIQDFWVELCSNRLSTKYARKITSKLAIK